MAAFSYTSRDYATIRTEMLARASQVLPEWTERDPSDFGMLLIDLWAHSADVLHYYIDRAAGEGFLSTATQRESVLAIANLLDYYPSGRASATASAYITNASTVDVTVSKFTPFVVRNDNKTYHAISTYDVVISPGTSSVIQFLEGIRYSNELLTDSASGMVGQRYTLSRLRVDTSTVELFVYEDGLVATQYQRVRRLTDAAANDRVFEVYSLADGTTQVVLGNSTNGLAPPRGSIIRTSYVESSGSLGNFPAGCVTGFEGVTPYGVSIVNGGGAFLGGSDEESIESMRRTVPSAFSTQNRAVTSTDFVSMATQLPGVARAAISFVPGLSSAAASGGSAGTNASVTIFPQTYRSDFLTTADTFQTVDPSLVSLVPGVLQSLALLGVTVLCSPTVTWQLVNVAVTVVVLERYVQNWVKSNVATALDNLFAFEAVDFGQTLHVGQIYQTVNSIAGVAYCTVTQFNTNGLTGVQSTITIPATQIHKKGTITIGMSGGITSS